MKDLTDRLQAFGEAKAESERKAHNDKVQHIYDYADYIMKHREELNMLIANANAAVSAGIKLNTWSDNHNSYEEEDFLANGIRHRLGFIRSDYNGRVVGLGVIGGGWNGDVSVVYKNGELFYDTDKYYDHHKGFMVLHPLESMHDTLLRHYEKAYKTFSNDILGFSKCFEDYLEKVLDSANH